MNFVPRNSVTMCWLLADGRPGDITYAEAVLDARTTRQALGDTLHPARRYELPAYDAADLELALRAGSPIATLGADLRKAAQAAGVQPFMSS